MKRFVVGDEWGFRYFLACFGDEQNLCNSCQKRFECYTGEIQLNYAPPIDRAITIEIAMFGVDRKLIWYDNETHDRYHNVRSERWERSLEAR